MRVSSPWICESVPSAALSHGLPWRVPCSPSAACASWPYVVSSVQECVLPFFLERTTPPYFHFSYTLFLHRDRDLSHFLPHEEVPCIFQPSSPSLSSPSKQLQLE